MNKVWLYKHIIPNISREVKNILNEEIQNFNPADYKDNDIIGQHTIKNMIYKYFPKDDEELNDLIEERIEENPKKPYLLDIDTSQIVYMSRLFVNEDEIEILDLSTWDTSNVTQMWNMFEGCTSLKKIILSNWDTSNVISMDNMFERCKSLESLDLSGWDTYNVTDMSCMFKGCYLLEELNLSGWQTSDATFIDDMFEECQSLKNVYTNDESIKREFNEFKKSLLNETINYNFDVADYEDDEQDPIIHQTIQNLTYRYFPKNRADLLNLIIQRIKENPQNPYLLDIDTSKITDMRGLFYYCSQKDCIEQLDLSSWVTSNVMDMSNMFRDCGHLVRLNINFNTSNVRTMDYMFDGCCSLRKIDVSNWDTAKVENMSNLFGACKSLEELDVSYWNTSNVKNMYGMFGGCHNLQELDLSNFDTSKVINMKMMFYCCFILSKLDVSNFDTSKVMQMSAMFEDCKILTSLDLSSFNTTQTTNMHYMFANCNSLKKLNLSNFQISGVQDISDMFNGCSSLEIVYTNDIKIKKQLQKIKKRILTENIDNINYNFDVADYAEDNTDIVSTQEITNMTASKADILINKVLSGNYNADEFESKEITLWNHRINGKIIDDNATIASYIDRDLPYPYFVNRLVSVDKIKKIGDVEMKTVDDEGLMVYTNYNFNKRLINKIMKLRKGTGKIGIFTYTKISYFIGVIIDTDKNKIIIYSLPLAKKLGFTENDINKGLVIIDKNLRNLLKDIDFDHINGNLNEVDYIYIGCYEYKIENL